LIQQITTGSLEHRREGVEKFLMLLRAGGSDYPMNLLKRAGVDLGTPSPAEAVVAQLDRRVSQLEAEIAKLKMSLNGLHPVVHDWFAERFGSPTPAQERAWPAIRAGGHVLISAPTGSGKTLAAFLICLDD